MLHVNWSNGALCTFTFDQSCPFWQFLPSFSSLEKEFPVRSVRTPMRRSCELEDLYQQRCLETDRWKDGPYCTSHRLLSACLSALPWGQAPNCWSQRISASLVGSHADGVLFLAPSSNPCLILNKCLNSSSEHGPHTSPPRQSHIPAHNHSDIDMHLSVMLYPFTMEPMSWNYPNPHPLSFFHCFISCSGELVFHQCPSFLPCAQHCLSCTQTSMQWVPQIIFTLNDSHQFSKSSDFWRMQNATVLSQVSLQVMKRLFAPVLCVSPLKLALSVPSF